ncbi:MAG: ATP-binding protein, partial [Rhodospirillales bacterium]|nr:ATP-binding protein [Rhodospirillales bacterium]
AFGFGNVTILAVTPAFFVGATAGLAISYLVVRSRDSLRISRDQLENEVKNRTEELTRSESRFRLLLESSPIGVSLVSMSTNARIYANPSLIKMFGAESEAQLLAIPIIDTYANPDDYHYVRKVHDEDLIETVEVLRRRLDGSTWWGLITRRRITIDGDDCLIVWYFDVTERKESALREQQAKQEAETANRAKSEFLSSMSHELRTPLNAILGFGQMLEVNPKEPLTESQKEYVGYVLKGGQHLLELIDDVLELAKVEAGKVALSIEHVQVQPVLDECLSLIRSMADERGIELLVGGGFEEETRVHADRTRFKQSLLNLMSNAVKYNRDEGKITIGCHEVPGAMLQVSVTDTGAGIPEDMQKELFEPFRRLGAENTNVEGTGIGLTITKQLIERMDGKIGFVSEVGKGSTFWIELPLARGKPIEEASADRQTAAEQAVEMQDVTGTVLYVEDNPANLDLMEVIVAGIGDVAMISAHNAELGIELAKSKSPDLIILDINLPGMDGFEALRKLQSLEKTKNIPVIALSANAMPKDVERGGQGRVQAIPDQTDKS